MKSPNRPSIQGNAAHPSLRKIPKRSSGFRWAWMLLGFTGVAMLSATAGAILAMTMSSTPLLQRKLSAAEAAVFSKNELSSVNSLQLPELTRPVNILVLGAKVLTNDVADDSGQQQKLGYHALVNSFDGLTDTMLLLRFTPATKKVVLLSIPRDTRVEIPGHGVSKINAANSFGGPALSAQSVSNLLGGVGIDRYVTINVQGVEALIDAVGGVTVDVPKDMKYQDDSQHLYVNLKAGRQHLNGNQALQLLRFRHDELGDIGRVQRQQMVMRALSEQTLNPTILARLPKILSVIRSHIDTNLTVEELFALVAFGTSVDRSNLQMQIVPGDYGDIETYGTSYWLPNTAQIPGLAAQFFDTGTAPSDGSGTANVRVAVQSRVQTVTPEAIAAVLERSGYSNVFPSEAYGEPLKTTRIIAQRGDVKSAEAIRQTLGVGEVLVDSTGDLTSDVTVQIGTDWVQRQTPAQLPRIKQ